MSKVGYARVSTTGQSLDVQMSKLEAAGCDKIYQEKRSGKTASRPEFKKCLEYIRSGDTLIITKLDRLARSVIHLSQIADRFQTEGIELVVIDQSIDTATSTGRLMFNMLSCIAEFENDLRSERQKEGIAKAKEKGIKFGRRSKLTPELEDRIVKLRLSKSVSDIAKELNLGVATIYRVLAEKNNANQ